MFLIVIRQMTIDQSLPIISGCVERKGGFQKDLYFQWWYLYSRWRRSDALSLSLCRPLQVEFLKVHLGPYKLFGSIPSTSVNVESVIVNENYAKTGDVGDIALVKLAHPVSYDKYIMPICLPSSSVTFPCGMECWVTGWGTTSYNGKSATM